MDLRERIAAHVEEVKKIGLPTERFESLLRYGKQFGPASLVENDLVISAFVKESKPNPNECFYNCQRFVQDNGQNYARYYEGYVNGPPNVLSHHAWLVVNGTVFDPTLEAAELSPEARSGKLTPLADREYFGVPFNRMGTIGLPFLDVPPTI